MKLKNKVIIHDNYIKEATYDGINQTVDIRTDVIIKCAHEKSSAEFIFIPTMLYQLHYEKVANRRI